MPGLHPRRRPRLANTYLVLASDNGFILGPHRFTHGKEAPYEESIRVPLLVRGPGIPAGQQRDGLVQNVDYAPTFVEWARASGVRTDDYAYVEYATGEVELYDIHADPYEHVNQFYANPTALLQQLSARVAALKGCRGASCR